ncbi:MAG: hypothetical protein ACO1OF_05210 [Adhaeribacter sp.]
MKPWYITLVLTFLASFAFADEQRLTTSFKSENGKFLLQYQKKKWTLRNELGRTLYSIKDKGYTSMTIFVSNDGKRLVIINDFIEGHIIGKRMGITYFDNGIQTSTYKVTELVKDTCNVSQTIWHTMWTLDDYGFIKSDSIFSVATFECNEIEFDTSSGEIISNAKPAPLDENTLIVIGKFRKGEADQCTMAIQYYIQGPKQPDDKITFTTRSFGYGNWQQTLMIKNGIDVTPMRFRNKFISNVCLKNK